jgi:hypothetical protein
MTSNRIIRVKKATATNLRGRLKTYLRAAKNNKLVLIENRRQQAKYLVDKKWLDELVQERDSLLATLEILADKKLTARLTSLAKTIDQDVEKDRLHTMDEVFAES